VASRDRYSPEYRKILAALIGRRIDMGLTQCALAERTGIKQSRISRIETGDIRLDLIDFFRYCRALDEVPSSTIPSFFL
jgi:transcriptional regulator with XRE-family HTH domain